MKRFRLQLLAAIAGALIALATVPPALALMAERAAAAASSAQLTPGPVCIGFIVTNCSAQPPRTSPLAFIALIVVGAWGTLYLSRNTPAADEPAEDADPQ
jgi:hypothetical protein